MSVNTGFRGARCQAATSAYPCLEVEALAAGARGGVAVVALGHAAAAAQGQPTIACHVIVSCFESSHLEVDDTL